MEKNKSGADMDSKQSKPPVKKPPKNIRETKAWQQSIGALQNIWSNYINLLKRSFQGMPRYRQCELITKYCQIITIGVSITALTFFYPFLPLFVKILSFPVLVIVSWWAGTNIVSNVIIQRFGKYLNPE